MCILLNFSLLSNKSQGAFFAIFWYLWSLLPIKKFNIRGNAACALTLNMYWAYWEDELFWWHVISYDLIHLDIFYSSATTPKSVHCKHPYLFRKFNKHLILGLGMCRNTYIGGVIIFGHFVRTQPSAHTPCCSPWSFYPKTVETTCPKWNAYKLDKSNEAEYEYINIPPPPPPTTRQLDNINYYLGCTHWKLTKLGCL